MTNKKLSMLSMLLILSGSLFGQQNTEGKLNPQLHRLTTNLYDVQRTGRK